MADLSGLQQYIRPAADYLLRVASYNGVRYRVTSVYRSTTVQQQLYAAWLAGRSPLPAAPPGRSLHQFGRAFDVQFFPYPDWQAVFGALWQQMGGRWSPADNVHFEA